jgi:hypothetical protein
MTSYLHIVRRASAFPGKSKMNCVNAAYAAQLQLMSWESSGDTNYQQGAFPYLFVSLLV